MAEASTPPSSWYTSRAVLEAEEERVLWRSWQAVGRADQVCFGVGGLESGAQLGPEVP